MTARAPLIGLCLLAAACDVIGHGTEAGVAPLVGRTITNEVADLRINADGTLTGKVGPDRSLDLTGRWEARDGQFCRTITAPPEVLAATPGTACSTVEISGDTVTFLTEDGTRGVWQLR